MEMLIRFLVLLQILFSSRKKTAPTAAPAEAQQQEERPMQRWPGAPVVINAGDKLVPGVMCVDGYLRAEHAGGELSVGPLFTGFWSVVRHGDVVRWGCAEDRGHAALGAIRVLEDLQQTAEQ